MMGAIPNNVKATSHAKMDSSMTDVDLDYELPMSNSEEFRKKFIEICKRTRLSAG
jgi:hypothetical protein